ncbi:MAG: hypothetical protein A3F18_04130 [Legionellales bacterium RIFCSPHIGHO2_12_FULL_37_14]|nr:MAG: hypothetical protein A3F18_04130 [Legionellales bacterium RIFCSPHIGHO2_12_FULL_37_14]
MPDNDNSLASCIVYSVIAIAVYNVAVLSLEHLIMRKKDHKPYVDRINEDKEGAIVGGAIVGSLWYLVTQYRSSTNDSEYTSSYVTDLLDKHDDNSTFPYR